MVLTRDRRFRNYAPHKYIIIKMMYSFLIKLGTSLEDLYYMDIYCKMWRLTFSEKIYFINYKLDLLNLRTSRANFFLK